MISIFKKSVAAALLASMTILSSCDIKEEDRYIQLPPPAMNRTVLLMDFTGQRCVNCPEAHEIMEELVRQYGDTAVIGVSIHAGGLALPISYTDFNRNRIGLMIEEGQEMNDAFGINMWPMGVVDRINDTGAAINADQWASAVRKALEQAPGVSLKLQADYDPVTKMINISSEALSTVARKAAMQFWIVENGIVATQSSKGGTIRDYVHNNVLRDVVFPVKTGSPVDMNPEIWYDVKAQVETKFTDKERWNVDSLSVVAFMFQGSEILNAIKVPVNTPVNE